MMIDHIQRFIIPSAYALLPAAMASDKATAMLLAIGWHESDFAARKQYNGPARGFWQFERTGTRGVLEHPRSQAHAAAVIDALRYRSPTATLGRQAMTVFDALMHNDPLACCLARLLLWTLPVPLPERDDPGAAWLQYVQAWKPGAVTHGSEADQIRLRDAFTQRYAAAWARVTTGTA